MRVLVVGGAGNVGSIICPALETEHDVTVFDRVAIPELGDRSIVADVNDIAAIRAAVTGMDAIIYMPMGVDPNAELEHPHFHLDAAFDVNVKGLYQCLTTGLEAGVLRYIYTSSLSVYHRLWKLESVDEQTPTDAWDTYGMSKRLGEQICDLATMQEPKATIIALRLCMPIPDPQSIYLRRPNQLPLAGFTLPHDLQAIFLSALTCPRPGTHVVQATGDVAGTLCPNHLATELFGYRPKGR